MTGRRPIATAILLLLVTAAIGLLLRPATPIDETRYLSVAWEMHLTGDWLVPSRNFSLYSDKPPLLFWAINLVWLLTGVGEFAARMVVPVFAAGAVWLTAVLAQALWPRDRQIGSRSALALAGCVVFAVSGGLTMFDVPLTVATLAGLIALQRAGASPQGHWLGPWAGFGAALALGVLIKGPVILFHLLPAALLLPLWSAVPMRWRDLAPRLLFGLGFGLCLVALWLVPSVIHGGPDYRAAILWQQSTGRITQSFAHARPWWFYLALLPLLTFPAGWSPSLWRAARHTPWLADRGLRLCLIWAGSALILFSLTSGKQAHYLVPELAALALVVARLLQGQTGDSARPGLWPAAAALAVLAVLAMLMGMRLIPMTGPAESLQPRSALLTAGLLILAVCWVAVIRQGLWGMLALSLGALLVGNLLIGLTHTAQVFSAHPIAARIAAIDPEGIAWVGGSYHAQFNFAARLTAPVATPQDATALRDWAAAHPRGLILGPQGDDAPGWPPADTLRFRNRDHGLWPVADAPPGAWE